MLQTELHLRQSNSVLRDSRYTHRRHRRHHRLSSRRTGVFFAWVIRIPNESPWSTRPDTAFPRLSDHVRKPVIKMSSCDEEDCNEHIIRMKPRAWDTHGVLYRNECESQCSRCLKRLCPKHLVINVHVDDTTDLCQEYFLCKNCYSIQECRMLGFLLTISFVVANCYLLLYH